MISFFVICCCQRADTISRLLSVVVKNRVKLCPVLSAADLTGSATLLLRSLQQSWKLLISLRCLALRIGNRGL